MITSRASRGWGESGLQSRLLALCCSSAMVLLGSGCSISAILTPVHLDAYRGDGVITKVRDFRTPGAQVDFEAFSLQTPYKKVYTLAGLPARPISYTIQLEVLDVPHFTWAKRGSKIGAEGILKFELRDSGGGIVFTCQGSPESTGWGQRGTTALGTPCDISAPRSGWASINPEDFKEPTRLPATLEIEWSPLPGVPDLKAHVVMKSGATC